MNRSPYQVKNTEATFTLHRTLNFRQTEKFEQTIRCHETVEYFRFVHTEQTN